MILRSQLSAPMDGTTNITHARDSVTLRSPILQWVYRATLAVE